MTTSKVRNYCVFISPVVYHALSQRHQALATRLSTNGYKVYYVNPIKSFGLSVHRKRESPTFEIIDIRVPYRAYARPFLQKIVTKIVSKLLGKAIGLDIESSVLWVADPGLSDMTNNQWKHIIYDRCDLHGSFPGQSAAPWANHEQVILRNSDIVFVSHPYLQLDLPSKVKSVLLPNAVNAQWLSSTSINKPRAIPLKILSSGAHFEWIDFKWLQLFTEIPNIELNIAGPGRGNSFKKLISDPNVKYHGILSHSKLQELMSQCHIGLIPFKDIELTKAVDPIKAYEYAAYGLELWGTKIQSIIKNSLIDVTIQNCEEALCAVKMYSNSKLEIKKVPTWNERIKTILDSLDEIE